MLYSPLIKWILLGGITMAMITGILAFKVQQLNQNLKRISTIDPLTKIPNRLLFNQCINQEWQRLIREHEPLSLIMCDVDYFKKYNDKYGHPAGDECLKKVANILSQSVKRSSDLVARYGGEEFVIILPKTNAKGAIKVANNIRDVLQEVKIIHEDSQVSKYVTLSLGIATMIPHSSLSIQELINSADQALYSAKNQGRDRYCYNPTFSYSDLDY
ncbi:MAG TPA: hypothetical protein DCF68_14340 [Cyanothece sp. UBA12306]|nr:hypothetical protein [Cyanothece sp. UBA12306]